MLVRLIGGPRHGERFEVTGPRPQDVIEIPYRDDDGRDPQGVTFGRAVYRAEKYVRQHQISRGAVRWQEWTIYLWSKLTADAVTVDEHLGDIMDAPPEEGMRPATPTEQSQWDAQRA